MAGPSLYVKWQGGSLRFIPQTASLIYLMNRRLDGRFGRERKPLVYLKSNEVSSIIQLEPLRYADRAVPAAIKTLTPYILVSNFRLALNVVCFLLGNSPASEFYMPTFRNTLSVQSS